MGSNRRTTRRLTEMTRGLRPVTRLMENAGLPIIVQRSWMDRYDRCAGYHVLDLQGRQRGVQLPEGREVVEHRLDQSRPAGRQSDGLQQHVPRADTQAVGIAVRAGSPGQGNGFARAFFFIRRDQLAALAARHAVPMISDAREFAAAGGLASYGASLRAANRQL